MPPRPLQDLPRHGGRRRQDLPDAAGGPGRSRRRARRRDRLPGAAQARGDERPGARAWRWCRAAGSPIRDVDVEEMDLPALLARAPAAGADRRARPHQPARASSTRKRYEDIADGARGRDRRLLDRQRPAPRVAERPGRRADRGAGAGDGARLGARHRRRGRPHRPHPGGAGRAPARGQDLPRRERSTRPSTTSSGSRTWRRCARSACARSPRTSSRSGSPCDDGRAARDARGERSPPRRRRRWGSGCSPWSGPQPSSQRLVRRAWRSAQRLGTDLDLLWVKPPGQADRGRGRAPGDGAAPARLGARRDAADRGARRPRRRRRAGRRASAAPPT